MKKLLLLVTALCVSTLSIKAQTTTVVPDTLHYFFNKYYFKTGNSIDKFPFYKSAAATNTRVTHVGSKFENNEPLEIKGIEAFMTRHPSSTNLIVPVRLYLCTLGVNGMPVLPALDSVDLAVSGGTTFVGPVGKLFNDTSYLLTKDFALLLRNVSLYAGDTVRLMRTNGMTNGNVGAAEVDKHSDGFGFVRFNSTFYSTQNFPSQLSASHRSVAPGFSPKQNPWPMGEYTGTDFEFCIAPICQYTLTSDHSPDESATQQLCPWEPATYTSHSSKRFLQRQYNLVEFARYWNRGSLFASNTLSLNNQPVFPSDSAVGWYFAPEDCYPLQPGWKCNPPDARQFLHYKTTTNQVTFVTDSVLASLVDGSDSLTCFATNEFRTRYKTMSIYGRGQYLVYNDTFMICTSRCGQQMNVGIREQGNLANVRVYPNPASGFITVSGLGSGAVVSIFNITGQLVAREAPGTEVTEMDIHDLSPGVYLVRIAEGDRWRSVRLIKE